MQLHSHAGIVVMYRDWKVDLDAGYIQSEILPNSALHLEKEKWHIEQFIKQFQHPPSAKMSDLCDISSLLLHLHAATDT